MNITFTSRIILTRSANNVDLVMERLREGLNVELAATDGRYAFRHPDLTHCDWCGLEFAKGEVPVRGYSNLPTHAKCGPAARRAFRDDNYAQCRTWSDEPRRWEPPEINYPNGQGIFE